MIGHARSEGRRYNSNPLAGTNGGFDAPATCHLEGLRIRESGMASAISALEAYDSQVDLMVSRSKLGKVFCSEGPRHAPVQQALNDLGLQYRDFQATGDGRPITQLRAEPFEACPHETDPPVEFERDVGVFVDDAVYV